MVFRCMRAFAGPWHRELEDLVQNACEQLVRSEGRFEGRCSDATWVWHICHHTWLKHQRWYRRWLRRFLLADDSVLPDPADDIESAHEAMESIERARRLRRALDTLSPKHKVVLVMHDLEGIPAEQVAQALELNLLTVRSRLRDGRRSLARVLKEDPWFGDAACAEVER